LNDEQDILLTIKIGLKMPHNSCFNNPRKLSSSHGLTGTRASSPQADRMSALPASILKLAQKVNRINNDKVNHHVDFN